MDLDDPVAVCSPCGIRAGLPLRSVTGVPVPCAICGAMCQGTDGVTWKDLVIGMAKLAHRPVPGFVPGKKPPHA